MGGKGLNMGGKGLNMGGRGLNRGGKGLNMGGKGLISASRDAGSGDGLLHSKDHPDRERGDWFVQRQTS